MKCSRCNKGRLVSVFYKPFACETVYECDVCKHLQYATDIEEEDRLVREVVVFT